MLQTVHQTPPPSTTVTRTTCPYCGVGCGVIAQRSPTGAIAVRGDSDHPANRGRLCSKGSALAETIGLEGRLLQPSIRGTEVSWDAALDHVASGFARTIATHGPESVALYVSGQLLTEDYYVANKLMKGYIGTANIDTNSRLCMSSAVAAHKRAFGEDVVPVTYEDVELADLIVLVGSNTAWCHPVLFQRVLQAKQARPSLRIVVIDPRRTATCEFADLHVPIRGGTDVWLFNGLLNYLDAAGERDESFTAAHTSGLEAAVAIARESSGSVEAVAQACGLDPAIVAQFYSWFATTQRVVTLFSQGVNQSSSGTDKANSIINCHLLTGRIGKPGMGPFSITGQPNAMGGREVGGLANMLAAHLDLENSEHRSIVQTFWNSPRIATHGGLKAVELFEAIEAGRIKAVWIMATNPLVSLPNADQARAALEKCDLVVVSDCVASTDTNAYAHVLLPAAAWGEKEGTVTNSERSISRQRAFLPLPGAARPDWWIIANVAKRMGFSGFEFTSAREIFVEHAALSGECNEGSRAFDISALADLDPDSYAQLEPVRWPSSRMMSSANPRPFADGRYSHEDGRARFVPTKPALPTHSTDSAYPLVLNTGRVRDQWHTMTRSGRSPRLSAHSPEPCVDIHPTDAHACGVADDGLARVTTRWGALVARVRVSEALRPGSIFVPIHWSTANASSARVGALVNPSVDPISGEPEFKHTPAHVESFAVDWYGFVLARSTLNMSLPVWWVSIAGDAHIRYEVAGRGELAPMIAALESSLGGAIELDRLDYEDARTGTVRHAWLIEGRVELVTFFSQRPQLPERTWLGSLFEKRRIGDMERRALLSGVPASGTADAGPIVCSCFGVGRRAISDAIASHALTTSQQVGQKLRAGTNCGSCVAEIRALLATATAAKG